MLNTWLPEIHLKERRIEVYEAEMTKVEVIIMGSHPK